MKKIEFEEVDQYEREVYFADLKKSFSDVLAKFIRFQGISKADLSRLLNVSQSYLNKILDNQYNFSIGTLLDMCLKIGLRPKITFEVNRPFSMWDNSAYRVVNDPVSGVTLIGTWARHAPGIFYVYLFYHSEYGSSVRLEGPFWHRDDAIAAIREDELLRLLKRANEKKIHKEDLDNEKANGLPYKKPLNEFDKERDREVHLNQLTSMCNKY